MGEEILDTSLDTIRVYPRADLWLGSPAFRQHATAGLAAASQDVFAPENLAHLNAAVELYTEVFLAGFTLPDSPTFDEWQFFQRESLVQQDDRPGSEPRFSTLETIRECALEQRGVSGATETVRRCRTHFKPVILIDGFAVDAGTVCAAVPVSRIASQQEDGHVYHSLFL